jgi:hypothetical protein
MSKTDRFVDTGKVLNAFAGEVLVTCTHCGASGVVHATWSPYRWHAQFECNNCHLTLSSAAGDWVGPVCQSGRRPCGYCGHKWLTPCIEHEAPPAEPLAHIAVSCPECGHRSLVETSLSRRVPEDHCRDPHFGLHLKLATRTRHGTVWVYNAQHLRELSGYVAAKLRVRQNSRSRAMFSRLPKWMKLAKHRDEISKALGKLNAMVTGE